mmetsp:Transcript_48465/g.85471  ORF Transcript_48465/g.85471 Transcript_48465/m.85471 type:complete len:700 (-) Transcript_48465:15-2114(-)
MAAAPIQYEAHNILITGAAGFIASHVAMKLVNDYPHYKVVALDCMDYCANLKNLESIRDRPNFKFVKGNIQSADLINYVLMTEEIDTIMHFAAQTHVDNSFGNSMVFTANNIYGTHTLLEASKALGKQIQRFVHVSTDEVYGENLDYDGKEGGNHESKALDPTNPYAATKAGAEMLVKAYTTSYGLPTVITRGNNVYGPHQFPEKLIPKMIMMASKGMKLTIHGEGTAKRSYLYVEDVASAFDTILHRGQTGKVYNIGTQVEETVMQVAESILGVLKPGTDPKNHIHFVEDRPFNDSRYYLDTTALASLGWKQEFSFKEGLKKTIEWYLKVGEPYWKGTNFDQVLVAHPRASGSEPDVISPGSNGSTAAVNGELKRKPPEIVNGTAKKSKKVKFLVFGKSGWLGGMCGRILEAKSIDYQYAKCRMQEREKVKRELLSSGCTHVLNCAGVTGRPNVDWCETHKKETVRANVIGTLTLVDVASELDIHVTNFATGCIFHYDDDKKMDVPRDDRLISTEGPKSVFTEEDKANFFGSFYSTTKGYVEDMLRAYDNVCTLRVRMPIDSNVVTNKRNFVYKIAHYEKVVNIPNSMTVLDELMPYAIELAMRGKTGIYNFTNPGAISHNQVLELYKEYIDPDKIWKNFTLEEQAKVITAARSNNELDASKLWGEFPEMRTIRESLIEFVFKPSQTEKAKLRAVKGA